MKTDQSLHATAERLVRACSSPTPHELVWTGQLVYRRAETFEPHHVMGWEVMVAAMDETICHDQKAA